MAARAVDDRFAAGGERDEPFTSAPYVDSGEVANAWAVTVLSGAPSPQKVEVRALCVPVGTRA